MFRVPCQTYNVPAPPPVENIDAEEDDTQELSDVDDTGSDDMNEFQMLGLAQVQRLLDEKKNKDDGAEVPDDEKQSPAPGPVTADPPEQNEDTKTEDDPVDHDERTGEQKSASPVYDWTPESNWYDVHVYGVARRLASNGQLFRQAKAGKMWKSMEDSKQFKRIAKKTAEETDLDPDSLLIEVGLQMALVSFRVAKKAAKKDLDKCEKLLREHETKLEEARRDSDEKKLEAEVKAHDDLQKDRDWAVAAAQTLITREPSSWTFRIYATMWRAHTLPDPDKHKKAVKDFVKTEIVPHIKLRDIRNFGDGEEEQKPCKFFLKSFGLLDYCRLSW